MPSQLQAAAIPPAPLEVLAHCRRTAAVARLIAGGLSLPAEEEALLAGACLLHHHHLGRFAPRSVQRLLAEIWDPPAPLRADPIPAIVREVLHAFEVPGAGSPLAGRLAGILRLADALDEGMEAQPLEDRETGQILGHLEDGVYAGLWPKDALRALRDCARPKALASQRLTVPVFPQAALRMVSLMHDPRASLSQMAQAAALDPATAGSVMQLANSALFGSRARLSTLSAAIARLGFSTARKVVLSAALHPLFGSPRLAAIWPHSVEVADLAEQLAARAGLIDPSEAYLAGLLHDAGRIALLSVPQADSGRLETLQRGGCPAVYAESLLLGTDHGALGARIAADWRLPESMVTAIGWHHRPEKAENPLAFLLYLAEFLSGSEEDLPSTVRLDISMHGLGLAWNEVESCSMSAVGSWLAAA